MTEQWSTLDPARLPPYLLTGGRVRPVDESLPIEAQVLTTLAGRAEATGLQFEVRDIVARRRQPLGEIAHPALGATDRPRVEAVVDEADAH